MFVFFRCQFEDRMLFARIIKPGQKDVNVYVRKARQSMVYQIAARAWSYGVPWADALKFSREADVAAAAAHPHVKGRGKGCAKGGT